MAVKGKQKEQKEFVKELFVGFTSVSVVAFNPDRETLNGILGREGTPEDKPLEYAGKDTDGNNRMRMSFVLRDANKPTQHYFYSFNLTNKERKNKDGDKVQVINATCGTTWVPYEVGTDQANEELIPDWFKNFTNKDKEVLGPKKWRKALSGEEELGNLIRAWLGRLNFSDPDTEVLVDTTKILGGDFREITSLIGGEYDTPFVVLLGVRTDEDDTTKKYQQVWGKQFLPGGFLKYIQNGFKFPSDYSKKVWKKFEEEVTGEYGFDCAYELVPIKPYDENTDPAASNKTKVDANSSDY